MFIVTEPRHEKTCLCHMRITKVQISLRIRSLISRMRMQISAFVVRCQDSKRLVAKAEISRP